MSTHSYGRGRQRDCPETPRTVGAPTHPPTAQAPQYIRLGVRSRTSRLSHTWDRWIRKRCRNPTQISREELDALQALGMRMRWNRPDGRRATRRCRSAEVWRARTPTATS